MVTNYNTALSKASEKHFSDGLGGGNFCGFFIVG